MGLKAGAGEGNPQPEISREILHREVLKRWREYVEEFHPVGVKGGSHFWNSVLDNTMSDQYLTRMIDMHTKNPSSHTYQLCIKLQDLREMGFLPKQPNPLPSEGF